MTTTDLQSKCVRFAYLKGLREEGTHFDEVSAREMLDLATEIIDAFVDHVTAQLSN